MRGLKLQAAGVFKSAAEIAEIIFDFEKKVTIIIFISQKVYKKNCKTVCGDKINNSKT
jgi:hypothetical protein